MTCTVSHAVLTSAGIDLGTSNSVVAVVEDGLPRVLADDTGSIITPSWVSYTEVRTSVRACAACIAAPLGFALPSTTCLCTHATVSEGAALSFFQS